MSQILLRRLSSHSYGVLVCSRLGSSGGPHCYSSGDRRRASAQDDESRAVRVSVWWDFENCNIPNGVNVCRVAPRVAAALRAAGIRGPLSITAFGDVLQLARSSQEALAATGVSISHVPRSGKNSSDLSFMADLVYWIAQNPPPVHFFLISGDRDFANMLHRLRMSNYNVLLACPSQATSVLCSAATIMWPWDALVKGENFSPKRYNHPPDGPFGSWYGHYKGALDDPFLEAEPKEPIDVASASKHCAIPSDSVPENVITAIQEVLSCNPEGMRLSVLRYELQKNNIHLGSDFFGHKKFSSLMQSMPDIVKFIKRPLGQSEPHVTSVTKRLMRPGEQSSKTPCSAQCSVKEDDLIQTEHPSSQNTDGKRSFIEIIDENPPTFAVSSSHSSQSMDGNKLFPGTINGSPPTFAVSSSSSDALLEDEKEYPTVDVNPKPESSANQKELDERTTSETPSPSVVENADNKDGLFKRIWILWNGPENAKYEGSRHHESTSAEIVDELQTPLQEDNADHHRKLLKSLKKNSTAAASANLSIVSDDDCSEKIKRDTSVLENSEQKSEPYNEPASLSMSKAGEKDDTSKMSKGLFSWASRWWRFGKSGADNSTTKQNAIDEAMIDSTEESGSPSTSTCGSGQVTNEIFTKSYFWDILEQQLSKPLGSELVSKAKTREELVRDLQKLGCWPLRGLLDKDLHELVHLLVSEKKWIEETPSTRFPFRVTLPHKRTCVPSSSSKHNGLSSIFSNVKPLQQGKCAIGNSKTNKPLNREEILSDCHKLLKELLLQYKYGFNISIFKHRFAKKHGYELDHKKLGYADLESLLQIMPDARVKFPKVLPAESENDQGGSKENGNQNGGDIWEELGPVSATTETTAGIGKEMCYCPPTPSDDEFSDNDCPADKQPRRDVEQSSLLKIIDSWNSSKDGGSRKKTEDVDGLVDCSRGRPDDNNNLTSGNAQRPTRLSRKQYFFVSDSEEDQEKDKLVESVLGSLQKAQGSKLNS
ncbi:hypothetical protein PR202_ga03936 [Eleusine coracana subsp. coracana]|uniref:HTH OST-type domain-containing protein n=1 Tax=Eleusine coracana subsp. coracana TaxID=191504 RepID=A0AAV5BNM2_ELECO|nr:hypothetical protein QOZ80_5AG0382540 [Eleusine coracana subsp. coracana]GJM87930.1 hypothetical protein PR202_ga03936 [Eleusine coracana subsp. coracana]